MLEPADNINDKMCLNVININGVLIEIKSYSDIAAVIAG
jgi:hypothetical protein